MGLMDKILDKMSLNSEDDEEFDNEDYMDDYEEEEELPRNPFRRKERSMKRCQQKRRKIINGDALNYISALYFKEII